MRKSRYDYISLGDKNTAYFHARTMEQRHRNKVIMLYDNIGKWTIDDHS